MKGATVAEPTEIPSEFVDERARWILDLHREISDLHAENRKLRAESSERYAAWAATERTKELTATIETERAALNDMRNEMFKWRARAFLAERPLHVKAAHWARNRTYDARYRVFLKLLRAVRRLNPDPPEDSE